jgi:glycine/D-amino acid oxidase-like deaminating enzyme
MTGVLPKSVKYCVIGAAVHGLSTAWHLDDRIAAWFKSR